jgi:hypothetical protein
MGLFYLKELFVQEKGKDMPYISHLASTSKQYYKTESEDHSKKLLKAEKLTEIAMAANIVCDVGENIYSRGFLVLFVKN